MRISVVFGISLFLILLSCNGQTKSETPQKQNSDTGTKIIGGSCEDCDLLFVGMPKKISSVSTSAGWTEKGQKLIITGTVFETDGKTPAKNTIVYYWQTDTNGYYSSNATTEEKAKKHGYLRGWIKTGEDGKYTINTIRPAPYPNDVSPAHLHLLIKEPQIETIYYVDDLMFDDDKLLIPYKKKHPLENRGGSGILRVLIKDDVQIAEHNIILGLNVPNYPTKAESKKTSGLNIGEEQPSFIPYHAFGPDKGSQACPVCKYGRHHGILYFVGSDSNWNEIKQWLTFLETESIKRQKQLKVYFVYGNKNNYKKEIREKELEKIGTELNLKNVALTFTPSLSDETTEINLNKINPSASNTFIIYKHRVIIDKYTDLKPTEDNFRMLSAVLDQTKGDYFNLPEPKHE